jgi:beta-lactamase class D
MVKKLMLQTANANYKLSYKIGISLKKNGKAVAWIVGWIEENKHPYFFVLQAEGAADNDLKTASMTVLGKILKSQGFFEGKR